ncbi:hypothetical protein BST81_09110 [Leptolyngbya sp. 'hensonii']|uniref:ParA family protein n=1 Tax=Leptolyngbya sp. 'hensonii' TaxID=1922337 RepID=UPI00094FD960|nr:ParA family protein [Leptolyngbya sp. 'hensonii']OLP18731.1 hypothetical protein BST81_09110 [Leptolyngbya sp. 'hensonii']
MAKLKAKVPPPVFPPVLTSLSLAGGQGKTTLSLFIGRLVALEGPVLFVDADPQHSLTTFLGVDPATRPNLLDLLTTSPKQLSLQDAIHPVPDHENLFLIPSNSSLETANIALANSGLSLFSLRDRLTQADELLEGKPLLSSFKLAIVDPCPTQSHLALTSLGAGTLWIIPAEANVKGTESLITTLELIDKYQTKLADRHLLGVVPFRARWTGLHPTQTTKDNIEVMREVVGEENVLPHILDSEVYKRAIDQRCLPRDLNKPDLEYPLEKLLERIRPHFTS